MALPLTDGELTHLFSKVKRQINLEKNIPEEIRVFIYSLKLTGYKYQEIADLFGLTEQAIRHVLTDPSFTSPRLAELYEKTELTMRERLMATANTILAHITEDDLEKASLLQKTTSIAQIIDKARLLQGKSTSNVALAYDMAAKGVPAPTDEMMTLVSDLGILE